jgi:hypothetical protein
MKKQILAMTSCFSFLLIVITTCDAFNMHFY